MLARTRFYGAFGGRYDSVIVKYNEENGNIDSVTSILIGLARAIKFVINYVPRSYLSKHSVFVP